MKRKVADFFDNQLIVSVVFQVRCKTFALFSFLNLAFLCDLWWLTKSFYFRTVGWTTETFWSDTVDLIHRLIVKIIRLFDKKNEWILICSTIIMSYLVYVEQYELLVGCFYKLNMQQWTCSFKDLNIWYWMSVKWICHWWLNTHSCT